MRCLMLLSSIPLIFILLTFEAFTSVSALDPGSIDSINTHRWLVSRNTLTSKSPPATLSLHRRAIRTADFLGPGWVGHIVPSVAIFPVAIGAQIFGKFYGTMAARSSGVWTAITPTNFYTISVGYIKLYIWSDDSAVQIGWNFVHSFAAMMLNSTHRGFVGLLDATFVHVVSGIMVHVKLIIVGRTGN